MGNFVRWCEDLLHHPLRVFWLCLILTSAGVVLDGSFIELWSLHREMSKLQGRISDAHIHSQQLDYEIRQAQQPEFIERQARDQLDLVREGDLVFIFADENESSSPHSTL
jgi:cell division protein FtsB